MLTQLCSTLKTILTASVMVISTSGTIAIPTAIASDIKQGCESLGGTYHSLENEKWICLYSRSTHNRSLGIRCDQDQQCDRLIYSRRTDGTLTLEWQPIIPPEQTDD